MTRLRRVDAGWALAFLLCLVAVAPLTAPGFFLNAHDATIGGYFLWQFDQGIAEGWLYPRWAMDWTFGYGYPLFVVIAPLAFYLAEAFHLLGAGLVEALKIVYALAFIGSGLSMYLLGRELFGRAGGLLAAALYVYAPYHLADIYVRADVAEFASFAFFPAILWAIYRLSRAGSRAALLRYLALGGFLYGCLILTHITMAMIFTPLALAWAGFTIWDAGHGASTRQRVLASLALFALGVAIGAAYLFPGFFEQRYLQARDLVGGYFGYAGHYVYPHQLLSPFWGYGYAAIGPADQMPYQLGVLAVVLALCSLWAVRRMEPEPRQRLTFFLLISGVIIFAMLSASQPLWDVLRPFVAFVQFPWRLLSLAALSLALAGGGLVAAVGRRSLPAENSEARQEWARQAAPLLALALLASAAYATPQYTDSDLSLKKMIQFQLDTKELLGDTIWVTDDPTTSPLVAQYLAGQPLTRAIPDDARAAIRVLHSGAGVYAVHVAAPAATGVLFQIRYFPGWKAWVDGAPAATSIRAPQGLMAVAVPAGEHDILLRFEDTPLRFASKLISLLGLAVAAALAFLAAFDRSRT